MGRTKELTAKQKKYCKARAAGMDKADAYLEAGYADNGRAASNANAYALEYYSDKSNIILQRIAYYQKQAEAGAIMDRAQRQAALTEIFNDTGEKTENRLRAADMLNRMSGDYSETYIHNVSGAVSLEDKRKAVIDALKKSMNA